MKAPVEPFNTQKYSLAAELSFCIHGHKNHFKFHVESSKPLAIIGVSGSGKSSLLKALACFDNSKRVNSETRITLNDRVFTSRKSATNPCVYVSDEQPLLARKNVLYALNSLSKSSKTIDKNTSSLSVDELIKRLELESICSTQVEQLSAGQRQRLRIGLALVSAKPIVILDEMLSNLDLSLRQNVLRFLVELHQQQKRFIILVSHQSLDLLAHCDHAISVSDFVYSPPCDIFSALQTQPYFQEHPFSFLFFNKGKKSMSQMQIDEIDGEFPLSHKHQIIWSSSDAGLMLVHASDIVLSQFKEADRLHSELDLKIGYTTHEFNLSARINKISVSEDFTLLELNVLNGSQATNQLLKARIPTNVFKNIQSFDATWLQPDAKVTALF